jgi:hypothetical protein
MYLGLYVLGYVVWNVTCLCVVLWVPSILWDVLPVVGVSRWWCSVLLLQIVGLGLLCIVG